jgi:nucleotide-binding universal stress UspA family protein
MPGAFLSTLKINCTSKHITMKKELNILIPTDFSDVAKQAIDFGIMLAEYYNIKMHLLNSYKIPLVATDAPYDLVFQEVEEAKKSSKENIKLLLEEIKKRNSNIQCVGLSTEGSVNESINVEIKDKKIDLVIIGSKGGNAIKALLFGSIPAGAIEKASCPIIVIPEKSRVKQIRNIIYATNLLDSDISALKNLTFFAKAFDAEVTITHIALPEEKDSRKWFDIFKHDVRNAISYKKMKFILRHENDFVDSIEKICSEEKVDMIVMQTLERSPFEKLYNSSLTKKVSYHTEIPLVVFHGNE